ncbi:hypothetical protein LTR35_018024 [Friedmanniomyces endolithicus]|uniref:NAD(P)-binding domain-containing protein n=1 Tax=Friedmanniomyces endolithicus TaxID=329885 RepID=A0AAN6J089_9PEZI|nr:hypothetical protein LTR35_018024 [Friedmanniomyces endolithicus]KAK0267415.1 hypothetical protein LTS00_017804 [Friedmanniomyces endolithicus]KAK0302000.1 hypothetical protein LTR82_018033 [Friedmanniomyces endolithicus]KAK0970091.1 hypothetical protein LTR54_018010 [Friedmanniomyces endolithicus]
MHILVLGTTGPSGLAFIPEALQAGHELTLYQRNPSKLPQDVKNNPSVNVVTGQFTDIGAVKQALSKGATVLVSFAGPVLPNKQMLIAEFYEQLFPLLQQSSIRRCMILSTASYKVPEDRSSWKWGFMTMVIKLMGGTVYQEINAMSRATATLLGNKVEWTLFRVPFLTNSDAKPVRAGFLGDGTDGFFLSRNSAAVWVLQELKANKWVGKAPTLSDPGWI